MRHGISCLWVICDIYRNYIDVNVFFTRMYILMPNLAIKWIPVVSLTLLSFSAFGASFNCDHSSKNIEYIICANKQLSQMDEVLSQEYKEAKLVIQKNEIKSLIQEQRDWLKKDRNECVGDRCLINAYFSRISTLSGASGSVKTAYNGKAPDTIDNVSPAPYSVGLRVPSLTVDISLKDAIDCNTATSDNIYIDNGNGKRVNGDIECHDKSIRFSPYEQQTPTNSIINVVMSSGVKLKNRGKFEGYSWPILTERWSLGTAHINMEYINGMAVDARNDLYVAGRRGSGLGVSAFSSSGSVKWNRTLNLDAYNIAEDIAAGSADSVYVAAKIASPTKAGTSFQGYDSIAISYSSSGDKKWIKNFGNAGSDEALGISTDSLDFVYVVGLGNRKYDKSGDLDLSDYEAFIKKLDKTGSVIWEHVFGSTDHDAATAVTVASNGDVYVAGWTYGSIGSAKRGDGRDIFLSKFTANGEMLWSKVVLTGGWNYPSDIAIDNGGRIYIVGHMDMSKHQAASNYSGAGLVMQVSSDGNILWERNIGVDKTGIIHRLAVDRKDNVYVVDNDGGMAALSKISSNGDVLWRKIANNENNVNGGVAVNESGDVFIAVSDGQHGTIKKYSEDGRRF